MLVECDKCGRGNCTACVPSLTDVDAKSLKVVRYRCPPCHGRHHVSHVSLVSSACSADLDHCAGSVE